MTVSQTQGQTDKQTGSRADTQAQQEYYVMYRTFTLLCIKLKAIPVTNPLSNE